MRIGGKEMNSKRLVVSILFGLLMGIICVILGSLGLKDVYSISLFLYVLANRTLIGFVIGISSIRINWILHGILIGFIVSIPFSIGVLLEPDKIGVFIASLILGMIYGFLIEFFTTGILKLKS